LIQYFNSRFAKEVEHQGKDETEQERAPQNLDNAIVLC